MGGMDGEGSSDWSDPREYDSLRGRSDPRDYDPYKSGGLSRNDPYRNMRSAEDETRPDFLRNPKGVASGKQGSDENESASGIAVKNDRAAHDLASVEEEASGATPKTTKDSIGGTRENEEEAGGFYSGSGKETKQKLGWNGGIGFKGFMKKRAPILAIFMTICGIGGAMFGAQSLLPFAIEELLIEKFNSIGVSATIVSDEMLDLQLNQGIRQGAPDPSKTDTLFGLSEYQVQQFKINGIDAYNVEAGGSKGAVMLYKKNGRTATIPVVGSTMLGAASAKEIKDGVAKASGIDFVSIKDPVGVKDALDDKDFYVPYTSASKVWRNGTSSWFDKIMKNLTEIKLNITRTRWARFAARSLKNWNSDARAEFNKVAAGNTGVGDKGTQVNKSVIEQDEKGNEIDTGEEEDMATVRGDDGTDYGLESSTMTKAANKVVDVLNSKAVRAAQAGTKIYCGLVKGAVTVYLTVNAYQAIQFLNLVTGFLEAVDRVKAGDGDTSPVMEYTQNLTTAANTKDGSGKALEDNGKKTAIASAGMSWLFGSKTAINSNDQSVINTNSESLMNNISLEGIEGAVLKGSSDARSLTDLMTACGYAQVVSEAVDLVSDIALAVVSFGAGNIIKSIIKGAAKAAIAVAVGLVVTAMISKALNSIISTIVKSVATDWFGEDLGNALVSGGSKYLGGNGTSGGQGPGTKSAVTAYIVAQQDVIAKEAEYQRATRSPFDIKSKYTFLGSLAYSFLPLAYSGGNLMSILTNTANTASSAIVAMLPTANAIDANNELSSAGECPLLDSAGAVGDAFCNPYIITDVNTTNLVAVDVYNTVARGFGGEIASTGRSYIGDNNLDSNGQIVEDSKLSKYVTYCGQRTSQYGVYDATIASDLSGENSKSKILDYVPLVGNISRIQNEVKKLDGMNYVTGKECVVGGVNWGENKYYQRYTENERLLEGMNPNYTSPVTAYLEDYYKENPLDTSFEGTLARFSGQTKEDVELALSLIEYYDYIENYNPDTRYAFVETKEPEPIYYESDTRFTVISDALALAPLKVVYADLRGKYYTV